MSECMASTGSDLFLYIVIGVLIVGAGIAAVRWSKARILSLVLVLGIASLVALGSTNRPAGAACVTTSISSTTIPNAATTTTTTAPAPTIQAAIFGDSLTANASPYITQDLAAVTTPGQIQATIYPHPGAAICDVLPQMESVATTTHPQVVVIEFGGNDFTPCISAAAASGSPYAAVITQYQTNLQTAINIFLSNGTTHVIVIAPPVPSTASPFYAHAPYPGVNAMYASFVPSLSNPAVTYFAASPWVVDPVTQQFTDYLPCKPDEISSGNCTGPVVNGVQNNQVRYLPDQAHLCVNMDSLYTANCIGYASGAWRMANAVVTAMTQVFSPAYSPQPVGP